MRSFVMNLAQLIHQSGSDDDECEDQTFRESTAQSVVPRFFGPIRRLLLVVHPLALLILYYGSEITISHLVPYQFANGTDSPHCYSLSAWLSLCLIQAGVHQQISNYHLLVITIIINITSPSHITMAMFNDIAPE